MQRAALWPAVRTVEEKTLWHVASAHPYQTSVVHVCLCTDIDECSEGGTAPCEPGFQCINTDGSYHCRCLTSSDDAAVLQSDSPARCPPLPPRHGIFMQSLSALCIFICNRKKTRQNSTGNHIWSGCDVTLTFDFLTSCFSNLQNDRWHSNRFKNEVFEHVFCDLDLWTCNLQNLINSGDDQPVYESCRLPLTVKHITRLSESAGHSTKVLYCFVTDRPIWTCQQS